MAFSLSPVDPSLKLENGTPEEVCEEKLIRRRKMYFVTVLFLVRKIKTDKI